MSFFKICFAFLILCVFKGISQPPSTTHSTINSFKVSYRSVPTNSAAGVQAIPQSTLTLKPNSNAVKIHYKMLAASTNSVLYQSSHLLNASVITNTLGAKLFENNNGAIFLSSGQAIPLKPYLYELQTEDAQGNLSPVYTLKN
jgi:hypothetical protein